MSTKCFFHGFLLAIAFVVSFETRVTAQTPEQGDVSVNTQTRISNPSRRDGGLRLALQGRLDAANVVQLSRPEIGGDGIGIQQDLGASLMSPLVTPGVRLLNTSLFLGVGLGFAGVSTDGPPDMEFSRSGFSFVPTATYDLLLAPGAALSVGGMLTLASIGETEVCDDGDCMTANDNAFGIGLSGLVGLRGMITEAIAIGTDFGWGFMSISSDTGGDAFFHTILGMILFEASIGL